MKATVTAIAVLATGVDASVVREPLLRANDGAVALSELTHVHRHQHRGHHRQYQAEEEKEQEEEEMAMAAAPKRKVAHFGDTRCPCIGFDNIKGETLVAFEDKVQASYPADLGARCEAWDDGRHPACKEGETPGIGNDWCGKQWCYVDACNCDIPIVPKVSSYVPDARYRGRPIFFSYATCGASDLWSKEVPKIGTAGCRCIGFDNIPGSTDVTLTMVDGSSQVVSYPAEIGGTCHPWDEGTHPMCRGKGAPKWCKQRWCYVDPCSCDLKEVPKVTMYLPEATFTGKSLYYSYETCGSIDHFTEKYNVDACVNQESKDECLELKVKSGGRKCAWTGDKCLGWELVEHPLCKKVAGVQTKSGAVPAAGRLAGVVGVLLAAIAAVAP